MTAKKKAAEEKSRDIKTGIPAENQPAQRRLVIQTDGIHVNIIENQLSVLEMEAVARRILEQVARL